MTTDALRAREAADEQAKAMEELEAELAKKPPPLRPPKPKRSHQPPTLNTTFARRRMSRRPRRTFHAKG